MMTPKPPLHPRYQAMADQLGAIGLYDGPTFKRVMMSGLRPESVDLHVMHLNLAIEQGRYAQLVAQATPHEEEMLP